MENNKQANQANKQTMELGVGQRKERKMMAKIILIDQHFWFQATKE